MTDLGTIHLVDAVSGREGTSTVTQTLFYYCLTILRLAGAQKVSMSKVERAISSELRRRRMSLDFGSVYSAVDERGNDPESNFDCKYKHIPLLLLDTAYRGRDTYHTYRDNYEDLTFDVFGAFSSRKVGYEPIVEAAIGRVVVVDSSSTDAPPSWSGNCRLDIYKLLCCAGAKSVKVVRWFVSKGRQKELDVFVESVDRYSDSMIHVLVRKGGDCWDLLKQSPYLEAVNNSVVVDFPRLPAGFQHDFSRGITDEVPVCFASSGLFDDLIEFSNDFKLEDIGKAVEGSSQTSRFASFWS